MSKITINEAPQAQTPSEQIVKKSAVTHSFTDAQGRRIVLKKLSTMDKMNLFKIVGKAQENPGYFNYLLMAYQTVSIDGEELQKNSLLQLEAIVQRLGDTTDEIVLQMINLYEDDPVKLEELREAIKNAQASQNS